MVYSTRRFVLCLTLCYFVLVFFSPLSIAITSLGEERANLSAFRMFVRFALVWFCLFPLPLGVWEGLRSVIVHSLDFSLTFFMLFCSCVFSSFSIAITSLGEERGNLSAFRTFVRFALIWLCLFPLPFGVWEGLWTLLLPFFSSSKHLNFPTLFPNL